MHDEERRLIVFIILMFLIIGLYPYYFRYFYKPSRSSGSVEKEIVLDRGNGEEEKEKVPPKKIVQIPPAGEEKEYVLENGPLRIIIGSFGGTIKSIYLRRYKEKDGSPVLVSGEESYRNRLFYINLPDMPLVYGIERRDNMVILNASGEGMRVTKYITLSPDSYILNARVVIENLRSDRNLNIHNIDISTGAIYSGVRPMGRCM